MDLNERIARLLEPVPVFEEGRCLTEAGWWKRDMDFGEWTDPVPMHDFPACVDTSLMVIEAKWPKCHVSLFWSDKRQEYVARISDIRTEVEDREIGDGEGVTRAEALALALCAALEAEVK